MKKHLSTRKPHFDETLILTDAFAELPDRTKNLFFFLWIYADNDRTIRNTRYPYAWAKATKKDLQRLIDGGFIDVSGEGVMRYR